MRPAAELLLLAELVGLIVLERHQLFEPVHERISDIDAKLNVLSTELGLLGLRLDSSAQTAFYASPRLIVQAGTRVLRDELAREQEAPQVRRLARLSNPTNLR